jgi:uncharacterized membrane protein
MSALFKSGARFVLVLMALYIVVFGAVTALRHYHFLTQTWDLGIYEQTLWNTLHGRIMQNDLEEIPNSLGVHFNVIMFFILPGFAIFQSPYYLLLLQTVILGLGAWPLYLLARKHLDDARLAQIVVAGYLLYSPLHWLNWFDFHPVAFVVPTLLAGIHFLDEGRLCLAALFLGLAASTQENAILAVMFAGLYSALTNGRGKAATKGDGRWPAWMPGALVALVALVYFLLVIEIIMPALGGGLLRVDRYALLGSSLFGILGNIARQPLLLVYAVASWGKLEYVVWLFLPVLCLPFLEWRALLLIAPGLLQNILANYTPQFSSNYQYDATLIPGMFVGASVGLAVLVRRYPARKEMFAWVLFGAILVGFVVRSPIRPQDVRLGFFQSNATRDAMDEAVRMVPDDVSVAAHSHFVPHLANRAKIYMLGFEREPVDVLVVDGASMFGFRDGHAFRGYLDSYIKSGNYAVKSIDNRFSIIVRKGVRLRGE